MRKIKKRRRRRRKLIVLMKRGLSFRLMLGVVVVM